MEAPTKETKTEAPRRPAMLGLGWLKEEMDLHKILFHPIDFLEHES